MLDEQKFGRQLREEYGPEIQRRDIEFQVRLPALPGATSSSGYFDASTYLLITRALTTTSTRPVRTPTTSPWHGACTDQIPAGELHHHLTGASRPSAAARIDVKALLDNRRRVSYAGIDAPTGTMPFAR